MKQLLSLLFLFLIPFDAFATEAYEVQFHRMIRLPSDETERHQFLTSIDGFLRDMDVAK